MRDSCSARLSGQERYRLRQGNDRIPYEIQEGKLITTVVKIKYRRDAYKEEGDLKLRTRLLTTPKVHVSIYGMNFKKDH